MVKKIAITESFSHAFVLKPKDSVHLCDRPAVSCDQLGIGQKEKQAPTKVLNIGMPIYI